MFDVDWDEIAGFRLSRHMLPDTIGCATSAIPQRFEIRSEASIGNAGAGTIFPALCPSANLTNALAKSSIASIDTFPTFDIPT
jgi:hypothetical protein